jgi:hypothetical protein
MHSLFGPAAMSKDVKKIFWKVIQKELIGRDFEGERELKRQSTEDAWARLEATNTRLNIVEQEVAQIKQLCNTILEKLSSQH